MRRSLLVLATLMSWTACAVEQDAPRDDAGARDPVSAIEIARSSVDALREAPPDVCDLAAWLPDDDACSLVCDPDAFAARMAADGMDGGRCYLIRCALTDDLTVSVGVCLP